jgi:low affinity Fe/Cu permease
MDYSSEYDRFINRIYRLNMTLLITSILIIGCSLLALFYFIELNFRIITILALMVLLGLNYTLIQNKKNIEVRDFAKKFEIDLERDFAEFQNTIALYKKGEFEKIEAAFTNKKHRRSRGFDDKGPTSGVFSKSLNKDNLRIDAMKNKDYDDILEEITVGESLIQEANEKYAEISGKRWIESESKDKDLIEAGVDKLGDLVKTEWFERNAKDGAVKELYSDDD